MSGCPPEYRSLLEVLAEQLDLKEIAALFSQAQPRLLNLISELIDNLCCTPCVLTEQEAITLRNYRQTLKVLIDRNTSVKRKRTLLNKKPALPKLLAQITLSHG